MEGQFIVFQATGKEELTTLAHHNPGVLEDKSVNFSTLTCQMSFSKFFWFNRTSKIGAVEGVRMPLTINFTECMRGV